VRCYRRPTEPLQQERTRLQLLSWLFPRLQYAEHVTHALLESRHISDRHDRRTVGKLRASRTITTALQVDHLPKRGTGSERLWLADFVIGAYADALLRGAGESWEILTARHVIEVYEL